ncbi:MAG: hypothetical protein ACU0CO_08875 [Shimia sp.]
MGERPRYGPTRGEYLFRLAAGLLILMLIGVMLGVHGLPRGLVPSESILFGGIFGIFGIFLVVHSGIKLRRGDHR